MSKQFIGSDFSQRSAQSSVDKLTSPEQVAAAAAVHFPLCMRHLHNGLLKDHKLKHWGRLQYTLFLKGCGMDLDGAVAWMQAQFTQVMSTDQFVKTYAYSFRHMFGKEGARRNYTVRSRALSASVRRSLTCCVVAAAVLVHEDHHGQPAGAGRLPRLRVQARAGQRARQPPDAGEAVARQHSRDRHPREAGQRRRGGRGCRRYVRTLFAADAAPNAHVAEQPCRTSWPASATSTSHTPTTSSCCRAPTRGRRPSRSTPTRYDVVVRAALSPAPLTPLVLQWFQASVQYHRLKSGAAAAAPPASTAMAVDEKPV